MLIFNTTFHVEKEGEYNFLTFMKETYIPAASGSGFLHFSCFSRIHSRHGESGTSYALQFKVKNADTLDLWQNNEGKTLHKKLIDTFGDKVAGFSTIMEEIDL